MLGTGFGAGGKHPPPAPLVDSASGGGGEEQDEDARRAAQRRAARLRQEVHDEQGRRRFHGAFTGGFSAGYFNTVGSKEGWRPREDARASQRVENFMDEEDVLTLGLAGQSGALRTAAAFDTSGRTGSAAARQAAGADTVDAAGSGLSAALIDALAAVPLTHAPLGFRLLREMGWREGQRLGPRIAGVVPGLTEAVPSAAQLWGAWVTPAASKARRLRWGLCYVGASLRALVEAEGLEEEEEEEALQLGPSVKRARLEGSKRRVTYAYEEGDEEEGGGGGGRQPGRGTSSTSGGVGGFDRYNDDDDDEGVASSSHRLVFGASSSSSGGAGGRMAAVLAGRAGGGASSSSSGAARGAGLALRAPTTAARVEAATSLSPPSSSQLLLLQDSASSSLGPGYEPGSLPGFVVAPATLMAALSPASSEAQQPSAVPLDWPATAARIPAQFAALRQAAAAQAAGRQQAQAAVPPPPPPRQQQQHVARPTAEPPHPPSSSRPLASPPPSLAALLAGPSFVSSSAGSTEGKAQVLAGGLVKLPSNSSSTDSALAQQSATTTQPRKSRWSSSTPAASGEGSARGSISANATVLPSPSPPMQRPARVLRVRGRCVTPWIPDKLLLKRFNVADPLTAEQRVAAEARERRGGGEGGAGDDLVEALPFPGAAAAPPLPLGSAPALSELAAIFGSP